jgi:hypothetical protein
MPTYSIVARQRQPGFKVDIVSENGARNVMLGFESEQEAQEWVEASRRLDAVRSTPPGD